MITQAGALVASSNLFTAGKVIAISFGAAAVVPFVVLAITRAQYSGEIPPQYRTRVQVLRISGWCLVGLSLVGLVMMLASAV
jgi:hypothetical protein